LGELRKKRGVVNCEGAVGVEVYLAKSRHSLAEGFQCWRYWGVRG
jgi:hypothetical protein